MKRRWICMVTMIAMLLAIMPSTVAVAADGGDENAAATVLNTIDLQTGQTSQTEQAWKISLGATVLSNRGTGLAVHLNNPDKLKIESTDQAEQVYLIPISSRSTATDSQGNAVELGSILPGQKVQITFSYQWRSGSPRTAEMKEVLEVALVGDTLKAKSYSSVDDFAHDIMIGTVISYTNNQLTIYIESGRVVNGTTEYQISGYKRLTIPSDVVVADQENRATTLSKLQNFQRVAVRIKEASWAESYPPQYVPQSISKIQMIEERERIIPASELASLERVIATIQSVGKDDNGNTRLVVSPISGSREAKYAQQFTVQSGVVSDDMQEQMPYVYDSGGNAMKAQDLQVGSQVRIQYTGLIYGNGITPAIPAAGRIDVLQLPSQQGTAAAENQTAAAQQSQSSSTETDQSQAESSQSSQESTASQSGTAQSSSSSSAAA